MELPRSDAMDSVVFDQHRLDMFLNGTTALYKIFLSVVEDQGLSRPYSQKDILEKITESLIKYWHPLEAAFVTDPFTGYARGNFTDEENVYPSKVFIDICEGLKRYMEEIKTSMDKSYHSESELRDTIKSLKEELTTAKQELRNVNTEHRDCKIEIASLRSTVQHLQGLNKNKTDQIVDLQRANTVQLWEKEKDRLLKNSAQKMKDLESQVETLTTDKLSLQQKLQQSQTKLGAVKLKNEIQQHQQLNQQPAKSPAKSDKEMTKTDDHGDTHNILQLKQHVYVLEKDLKKVDSELHAQQKHVVGVLNGLLTDYSKSFDRILDHEGEKVVIEPNTFIRIKAIKNTLDKCLRLSKEGKLSQACADLPDYYVALDRDISESVVKKLSSSYALKQNNQEETPAPTRLTPLRGSNSHGVQANAIESKQPLPTIKKDDNPQIVNTKTGFVNHIMVLRHFPHFTRDYVQEQYTHFKEFDTNGDNTLDITEVLSAMTKTLGQQFTAGQIKEAMLEVDVDGDHTLDFYEYLKVADMLAHKNGQADVFRSDLVKQQGRNMSKTCIVM